MELIMGSSASASDEEDPLRSGTDKGVRESSSSCCRLFSLSRCYDNDDRDRCCCLNLFGRKQKKVTAFAWSFLVFLVVSLTGVTIALLFHQGAVNDLQDEALQLSIDTGEYFSEQLDRAILPLFSLSTFATELEILKNLPEQIGPPGEPGSLPSVHSGASSNGITTHRNVTGVCDQPAVMDRFVHIASTIKKTAQMEGILVNLQLAPQAVVCLLHPINNTEDFTPGTFLDSTGAWGLDLLMDPMMKNIAQEALSAPSELSVAGPLKLRQCPTCDPFFIARMPIFYEDYNITIEGTPYPRWGFATALINWSELVRRSDFVNSFANSGFMFLLTRTDLIYNDTEDAYVEKIVELARSQHWSSDELKDSVTTSLKTTNNQWEIAVSYKKPTWIYYISVIVVLVSMIIASLAYTILVQRGIKNALRVQSLEQSARVETELKMTAYFAHELRNPLGAIDCALESMPDDLHEKTKELIVGMQLCSRFMSSIMNNLLDARKFEEGKLELASSPISLSLLVEGVHKMLLPSVKSGVDLLIACETRKKDWVLGDLLRIEQVFVNVITNAIKNTKEGSITLSIKWSSPDIIKFECIDTGPGIPLKDQEVLFERFVQRGSAPGYGLGLTISRKIVSLMGGTIKFESNPDIKPGTNCVVELSLPECEIPTKESLPDTAPISLDGQGAKLLIVDDMKINRTMLERRIQKSVAPTWEIFQACTGEEALKMCEVEEFDVIIMDQYMESANGVLLGTEAIAEMRKQKLGSVIVGNSGNDLQVEFKNCGADLFWSKPLPSNIEMVQQLHTALVNRRRSLSKSI